MNHQSDIALRAGLTAAPRSRAHHTLGHLRGIFGAWTGRLFARGAHAPRSDHHASLERLLELDERMLADIGLTRRDVRDAMALGCRTTARRHLDNCRRRNANSAHRQ